MADSKAEQRALQRAQFRKTLARMTPKQRVDALLSETDAKKAVHSVSADELYRTVLDVGLADTTEIVQLASPAQFRTFVDLGAWKKDDFDVHELMVWLRAAHGDEDDEFLAKLDALDFELLELLLRRCVVIHDLEEDPDANPEGVTMESPEGKYLLEFKVEGPDLAGLRALINTLIARDPFVAGRIFEAVRWELDSELEEEAYRFRASRLQDLGFPELYDALALFAYVDTEKISSAVPESSPSSALAIATGYIDYVARAFEQLDENERDRADEELRYVVNRALVAEGADPGDLSAMRRVAEMARDYLSLGLEQLCRGAPAQAAAVMREYELKRVFQIGFSLTLELKFRVDRMAKRPLAKLNDVWLLLPEESNVVSALARKRPLKAVKVEGAEPMPFRARRELLETSLVLDRAEQQLSVFEKLLGGTKPRAAEILQRFDVPLKLLGADRLFATAVAHAIVEGEASVKPFPVERFDALLAAVIRSRDASREKAFAVLSPLGDPGAISAMVDRVLHVFAEEWGPAFLANGSFDPKLVLALALTGVKTL